jgi:transglutaminase superfamily protein
MADKRSMGRARSIAVNAGLTAGAFLMLVSMAALTRLRGFKSLHNLVKGWPLRGKASDEAGEIDRVSSAVARALPYSFTSSYCLRRAATIVCMLRLRGVDAKLVIGVLRLPFSAHAWAEVKGKVVDGTLNWQGGFRVIERL